MYVIQTKLAKARPDPVFQGHHYRWLLRHLSRGEAASVGGKFPRRVLGRVWIDEPPALCFFKRARRSSGEADVGLLHLEIEQQVDGVN